MRRYPVSLARDDGEEDPADHDHRGADRAGGPDRRRNDRRLDRPEPVGKGGDGALPL